MLNKLKKNKWELILIAVILLISGIVHGYNMFHFPYYENDEGSYSSYAWALLTQGKLSPYTYWYDHAPAGWILIALWMFLTGGVFTFGFSLNSGRVLMLVLHLLSSLLLYLIGKKLTRSTWAGALSVIIFSTSPLGIYFQRRILLDNIMAFWILLSLFFILYYRNKLRFIVLSAITFGIGLLSKENAIFFVPIFIYIIYLESHEKHKSFALLKWIAIVAIITSYYFLYALIRGELFPSGTFLGGSKEHVSLLATLKEQYGREGGGIFDPSRSSFWQSMKTWLHDDPAIIYAGAFSTVLNLLIGFRLKIARIVGLLAASMWLFLLRGGMVIEFYILPLLPFLALNIAFLGWVIQRKIFLMTNKLFIRNISYGLFLIILISFSVNSFYHSQNIWYKLNLFYSDQTTPQIQAVNWILSRNTPNSFYVIDNYALIDLWAKNSNNFRHAEWYWKVDKDPAISKTILKNDPKNIDYIALTPQMEHDITTAGLAVTLAAWHNSKSVVRFWKDGWGVEFWATQYPEGILQATWESYKTHFIFDGRTVDPRQNNATTSEAQSYALLRAVWTNDKNTFDEVYEWSKNHLQQTSNLFSWRWEGSSNSGSLIDDGTATDADQDIALALLFAYKQWGQENYLLEAKKIIAAIWEREVVVVNNIPYLIAGNWANHESTITINPSYLSPATYRVFAKVDNQHPWLKLVDSSYRVLQNCTTNSLDKQVGVLPPEWCAVDKKREEVTQSISPQPSATEYSYNAFRIPWRVALDYQWFKETEAKNYLETLSFLSKEWREKQKLSTVYQHDGSIWEKYESVSAYAGNLGYFSVLYPEIAKNIYSDKILNKFYEDENQSYWEDPKNYYTQNWAWFGTALYSNSLPNLWRE